MLVCKNRVATLAYNDVKLMDWNGLIPIFSGIYGYLLAIGYFPNASNEPDKMELWRKRFGGLLKKLCPVLILFGIIQLSGVFQH